MRYSSVQRSRRGRPQTWAICAKFGAIRALQEKQLYNRIVLYSIYGILCRLSVLLIRRFFALSEETVSRSLLMVVETQRLHLWCCSFSVPPRLCVHLPLPLFAFIRVHNGQSPLTLSVF